MMKALFREEGAALRIGIIAEQPAQDFIQAHAQVLDGSFTEVKMSDTMRSALQRSNYIFSGFKTFHELNEAAALLIDSNGNRKPFEQFLNDVRKIDDTYNRNYLRAEYNFCHSSAQMAAKWDEFQADGDDYNLQYRTAADGRVRPEHAALHGVTLPPSDPFWKTYFPPNGWNCRCNVVQVLKEKYPETPRDEAMRRGAEATGKDTRGIFRFNPGIERKSFPDYNPYTISRCRDCDIAKGNLKLARPLDEDICQACQVLRQMRQTEENRPLNSEERRNIRLAAQTWAERHLDAGIDKHGQPTKSIIIEHNRVQQGILLKKDFFKETFAKGNKPDNSRFAEQMELATKITEWLPKAKYVRTEAGKHHPYPFDVYETTVGGVSIECKVAMKYSGAYAYTMRIKEN